MWHSLIPCSPSPPIRFKEFDNVTGRIWQDLPSTIPVHDIVAEVHPCCAELFDQGEKILDFELNTVPAARLWTSAIWHRLGRSTGTANGIQEEAQIAVLST